METDKVTKELLTDEELENVVGGTNWGAVISYLKKNNANNPDVSSIIDYFSNGNMPGVIAAVISLAKSNPRIYEAAMDYEARHR